MDRSVLNAFSLVKVPMEACRRRSNRQFWEESEFKDREEWELMKFLQYFQSPRTPMKHCHLKHRRKNQAKSLQKTENFNADGNWLIRHLKFPWFDQHLTFLCCMLFSNYKTVGWSSEGRNQDNSFENMWVSKLRIINTWSFFDISGFQLHRIKLKIQELKAPLQVKPLIKESSRLFSSTISLTTRKIKIYSSAFLERSD